MRSADDHRTRGTDNRGVAHSEPSRDISFETPAARVRLKQLAKPNAVGRADMLVPLGRFLERRATWRVWPRPASISAAAPASWRRWASAGAASHRDEAAAPARAGCPGNTAGALTVKVLLGERSGQRHHARHGPRACRSAKRLVQKKE
jgi:hypothetical protein